MANGGKERCDGPDTTIESPVISLKMLDGNHTIIYPGRWFYRSKSTQERKKGSLVPRNCPVLLVDEFRNCLMREETIIVIRQIKNFSSDLPGSSITTTSSLSDIA